MLHAAPSTDRPLRARCPLRARARLALALALLLLPSIAHAQPVGFQLKNDVPAGSKPTLKVIAVDEVADIVLDLARDDGQRFTVKHAGLAPGGTAVLTVGDGAPGKAHYTGHLAANVLGPEGGPWSYDLAFDTLVRAPVTITYDLEHLDLAGHRLSFQLSRPARRAEVTVFGESGEELGRGEATYDAAKAPPGTWLPVAWRATAAGAPMRIRLRAVAEGGLADVVELVPWAVAIAHEEVSFASGSAEVPPAEAKKLEAALARILDVARRAERFIRVKLYVAGHTDTVGARDANRRLSLDRARAISAWFRAHGCKLPIAYDGFGEEALAVPTPDETDEPRNRRADYVLGAAGAPPSRSVSGGRRGEWKPLP